MKTQFVLLILTLLLFALFNQNGQQMAFSYATSVNANRNWAADLYQRAQIWFDKSLEDVENAVKTGLEKLSSDLDARIEKANGQTKQSVDGVSTELKGELKNLTDKVTEIQTKNGEITKAQQEQLDQISTELKRGNLTGPQAYKMFKDVAQTALEEKHAELRAVKKSQSARFDVDIDTKAVVMESTSLTGDVIAADRRAGIVTPMVRRTHLRSLLFRGTTTSADKWDYTEETAYTDGTATVAEGAAIPKSDMTMVQKRADVKKIASSMDLSNEIIEDIPGLLGYVNGRLYSKYNYKEDNQLLFGSGTGTDIRGVYTGASAFAPGNIKPTNNPNFWDVLTIAGAQMSVNEYGPTAAVVSVQDFYSMALTKNTQGNYILPIIFAGGTAQQRIMEMIVVPTTAMATNNWLVGDFEQAAEIVDRRMINIQLSNENKDNFERDLVTLRLTARLALPIYYPGGFVKGTFTGAGGGVAAITPA